MSSRLVCSIIIPSYRAAQTIGRCLTALLKQDIALPYEIIVVDSSPDETPDLIRRDFPQVQLIHLPHKTGPAMARNIGAQQARGEILAFIDADCVAGADWLRRLYTLIQQGYNAVGGAIANGNSETLISWASYICEFREFLPAGPPREVSNLTLGNVAYRRATFWAAGGFPARCFPQEDQVFHYSLQQRGGKIYFDPGIVVAHTHRTERAAFLHHQHRIGRANARVLGKLDLSGSAIARRPWLALLTTPALILWRFVRTIYACWWVEHGLVWRQPALLWLCWLGMCWWGRGFVRSAGIGSPRAMISRGLSYAYPRR